MREHAEKVKDKLLNFNLEKKRKWAKERKPYSAFMELTPKCNMNCVHCYLQDHRNLNEMSYSKVIEILDILCEKGILFLAFSGGEIFTRKDFIDIYMYAKRKGFMIELFSNGLSITNEILDVLKKYPPLLIDISLYGACEETYYRVTGIKNAYEKVKRNCKKLLEMGIRVSLKTPILIETQDEVDKMREFADELGIPFCVSYEIDVTIDNDPKTKNHQLSMPDMLHCEFEDYRRFGKKESGAELDIDEIYYVDKDSVFICNVAQTSFIIDYEGRMCPCMKFRHRGIKLEPHNFDLIWAEFGELQKLKASASYKCKDCEARYYCDACAAERELMYGDLEAVNEDACKYAIARHAFYRKNWSEKDVIELFE